MSIKAIYVLIWVGIAFTGYKWVNSPLGEGVGWWGACIALLFVVLTMVFWGEI